MTSQEPGVLLISHHSHRGTLITFVMTAIYNMRSLAYDVEGLVVACVLGKTLGIYPIPNSSKPLKGARD